MVAPITPQEVAELKVSLIPDEIIAVINKVIAKNFDGSRSRFKQEELLEAITSSTSYARHQVFTNKWLDFEDIYRKHGWDVSYDKPAFNETYDATFTLTVKR